MANLWLRLWHDMPNDPKWRTIARISQQSISEVQAVYLQLLVSASTNSKRGWFQATHEDIASALDLALQSVTNIVTAMQGRVLDETHLSGWEVRQPTREDNSAIRVKKWRERNVTQRNAQDKDKEKDKEEKKQTAASVVTLPDFIKPDVYEAWREMRRKVRNAPFTERAERGIIADLGKLREYGIDPNERLHRAMTSGWRGVLFPDDKPTAAKLDPLAHMKFANGGVQ